MRKRLLPWLYLSLILAAVTAGAFVPWEEWLQEGQGVLLKAREWYQLHPTAAIMGYAAAYILFTGLSLPGALFLTIFGGWLFGMLNLVIVSFASSAGATMACWLTRTLFREYVLARHGPRWQRFQAEFVRFGWLYLLAVRLNPAVPFFLVNLFFGLTRMPLWQFWIVSQLGMLPITALYVWAGAELGRVESLSGLVSTRLVLVLVAASVIPLLLRLVMSRVVPTQEAAGSGHE